MHDLPSILLNAPGSDVTSEETMVGLLVSNLLFLAGILVFAVILGMVGEEVGGSHWLAA